MGTDFEYRWQVKGRGPTGVKGSQDGGEESLFRAGDI